MMILMQLMTTDLSIEVRSEANFALVSFSWYRARCSVNSPISEEARDFENKSSYNRQTSNCLLCIVRGPGGNSRQWLVCVCGGGG